MTEKLLAGLGPAGRNAGAGKLMGSPDYISPEQATAARDADIRSDIYSLGATFYRILTGEVPFEGGDVRQRVMARLVTDAPRVSTRRADMPAELDEIVARMLAREPEQRYQTPAEVAGALFPFTFEGEKVTANVGAAGNGDTVDSALGSFFNRMSEEQDAVVVPRNKTAVHAQPAAAVGPSPAVPAAVVPLARIIHRPVAGFVRSLAVTAVYGQNSHEFCYAECAADARADE